MTRSGIAALLLMLFSLTLIGWGLSLFDWRLVPLAVGALLWFDLSSSRGEGS